MAKHVIFPHDEIFENALSISQIIQHSKCRRAWKYSYVDGLAKKYERTYLTKGKLAHSGMQAAMLLKYHSDTGWRYCTDEGIEYVENVDMDALLAIGRMRILHDYNEYIESLNLGDPEQFDEQTCDLMDELERMYAEAIVVFQRTLVDFQPDKWEILTIEGYPAIELHFALPIRGMKWMHGFIDLVARERETNQIWELDWKFKSSLSSEEDEVFNIQNSVYCRALKKAGVDVTGSITFQSLNIPPTAPNINKNGTISRAKIRITWPEYAMFCQEHGQDPDLYQEEMEPKLADVAWTRPIREYRSDFMMNNIWENVVQSVAYEIASKRKNKRYPPAIGPMNCKGCAYMALCQGELRGYDTDFILNSEYVSKLEVTLEEEDK